MEGGLGREGYKLGVISLTGRIPEPAKPAQPEAPAVQAETQMEVMKARLRAPMRAYAEERGATGNLARPLSVHRSLGIGSSDPIAAQAAFELVLELSQGRENELTWVGPLVHFTHDFESSLGGSYTGLSRKTRPWIQPVFLLACRALQINKLDSVWAEELIQRLEAQDSRGTLQEQLGEILRNQGGCLKVDALWRRMHS